MSREKLIQLFCLSFRIRHNDKIVCHVGTASCDELCPAFINFRLPLMPHVLGLRHALISCLVGYVLFVVERHESDATL